MNKSAISVILCFFYACVASAQQEKDNSSKMAELLIPEPAFFFNQSSLLEPGDCYLLFEIRNQSDSPKQFPKLVANTITERYNFPGKTTAIMPGASLYYLAKFDMFSSKESLLLAAAGETQRMRSLSYSFESLPDCAENPKNSPNCVKNMYIENPGGIKLRGRLKDAGLLTIDTIVENVASKSFAHCTVLPLVDRYFLLHDSILERSFIIQSGSTIFNVKSSGIDIQKEKFHYQSIKDYVTGQELAQMVIKIKNNSEKYLYVNRNLDKKGMLRLSYPGETKHKSFPGMQQVLAPGETLFLKIEIDKKVLNNNSFKLNTKQIFSNCSGKQHTIHLSEEYNLD